jgi:chromosome segregation ATPase
MALAGCGRDDGEQALSDATIKLAALDVGVGTRMPEGVSTQTYNEVVQSMQPLASGQGALAADAAVLLSNAQRGLGIHHAAEAAELEKNALNMMPGIRARLRAWQMHNAAAAAAAAYDPAPELARIDADVRARQEDAERVRAAKQEIEQRIAGLLNQVADRLSQASALRDQAGSLQLQIPAVSATEGLALAEQIRELSRQADKLEFEARDLKNQADNLALDVASAEVEITKLTTQGELFGQSRAAVQSRAKAAQEHAASARGDAQEAAVEIAERVDTGEGALTPYRQQQVAPATERAISQFQTAAASARPATSSARRSNAQLALGQAQQSLGDAHWTSALGLDTYAQLMEELAAAEPPLPSAAEYASRAQQARTQANESRQAAYDAYQAAKSAFGATGASGDAKALLDQVSARLNEISRAVGKGVVSEETLGGLEDPADDGDEAESDASDEPADESENAADASTDSEAELRAAIQDAIAAMSEGRIADLEAFLLPASQTEQALLDLVRPLMESSAALDEATNTAFGQRFTLWMASDPEMQQAAGAVPSLGFDPMALYNVDVQELDLRVRDDEAILLTESDAFPELNFRREGGHWRLVLDMASMGADPATMEAQLAQGQPIIDAIAGLYDQARAQVESGELQSNRAVGAWINSRVAQVIMEQMEQMQSPGGG